MAGRVELTLATAALAGLHDDGGRRVAGGAVTAVRTITFGGINAPADVALDAILSARHYPAAALASAICG